MAGHTTNFNLIKPADNENADIADINGNMDILDEEISKRVEKVDGKGLSTNDFDDTYKDKVERSQEKPTYAVKTMAASSWNTASKTYSFEALYPVANYDIEIQPDSSCTQEQIEAWGSAMIVGSSTSNVAKALGEIPTVDIPVIVKVVRK